LYVPGKPAAIAPERFRQEFRSVESDGWKLIESSEGSLELYNLRADPGELQNQVASRPDLRDRLSAKLQALPLSVRLDESATNDISKEAMENLRALGYVE
jgi:arylsulfatase A-like enzyme